MAIYLEIEAESVKTTPSSYSVLDVQLEGVDADTVLEQIDIATVAAYYDTGDLLDAIGEQEAIDHFKIEVSEE